MTSERMSRPRARDGRRDLGQAAGSHGPMVTAEVPWRHPTHRAMHAVPVVPVASVAMPPDIEAVLSVIDAFGADHAAAALVGPDGVIATHGEPGHRYDGPR